MLSKWSREIFKTQRSSFYVFKSNWLILLNLSFITIKILTTGILSVSWNSWRLKTGDEVKCRHIFWFWQTLNSRVHFFKAPTVLFECSVGPEILDHFLLPRPLRSTERSKLKNPSTSNQYGNLITMMMRKTRTPESLQLNPRESETSRKQYLHLSVTLFKCDKFWSWH